jgi:Tol biopolymer transport system component
MDESNRLDSWKQIAAYLGRSQRTVRRWQETEGMPVHRHLHQQRGSVWAYRTELDAWLNNRRLGPEPLADVPSPGPTPRLTPPARVVFIVAGAVLITLVAVLAFRTHQPAAAIREPVQITALPGAISGPAFSPDGQRLVFRWLPASQRDPGLYLKTIGDENLSPLVTTQPADGNFVYSPSWSPDGKTIAFIRRILPQSGFPMYATASESWLCVIPVGGGPERRILRLAKDVIFYANSAHLSWSGDSQWILAPMADGDRLGIHRISVRTGDPVRITQGTAKEFAPALSPDGSALVFMRQEGPPVASIERVLRQDLTAKGEPVGQPSELFTGRSMSSGLAWMPSGKELIFCTAASAFYGPFDSRLYRMSAEVVGRLVPLGLSSGCSTVAVSRPDSHGAIQLVYAAGENTKSNIFNASLNELNDAARLAPSSRFDALPSHSPDGSLIAFISNRTGQLELWLTKPDGSGLTRLTENSHIASTPRWSPDGKRLVYGSAAPPTDGKPPAYALYIVPVGGSLPTPVPITQPSPSDPFWSPDGESIYYWSGSQLWRTRPNGNDSVQIADYPAHFVRPGVIHERHMYYTRPSKPFALVRTALDGDGQILADGLASPFFAITGKFVYYVRHSDQRLCLQPIASGPTRTLGSLPETKGLSRIILGMSVSPDDQTIVWAITGEQQLDLHLVRDFR